MHTPNVTDIFPTLEGKLDLEEYNLKHFRTKHIISDVLATLARRGIEPCEVAPDFRLPSAEGGHLRLSDLRGKPVLLRFGSTT